MIPRLNSLKQSWEIKRVLKNGSRYSFTFFTMIVKKQNYDKTRIAFLLSKKIDKSAVNRNFIKRRLRALFSKILYSLHNSFDIVIVPRQIVKTAKFNEMEKQMKDVEKKLGS